MSGKPAPGARPPPDALSTYREKRDFAMTPEPPAQARKAAKRRASHAPLQFVIQKHWARRLHYDFRLEIDGTMKSWAVPKGPSLDPAIKRMAVHVEDHPLAYNTFEGTIPRGQYGAGKVIIWDRGVWRPETDAAEAYRSGKLKFTLSGTKLQGRWALIRMGGRGADDQAAWLLIKEKDEHARPQAEFDVTEMLPDRVASLATPGAHAAAASQGSAREPPSPAPASASASTLPESMAPQLATRVSAAPGAGEWLYELKYDGYRILARVSGGRARLHTRQGHDWSSRLPTIAAALESAALPDGWYDGEIVVLGPDGKPDFQALQNALEHDARRNARRRGTTRADPGGVSAAGTPRNAPSADDPQDGPTPAGGGASPGLTYFLFDLPWLEERDLRRLPLHERRARLEQLLEGVAPPVLRLSAVFDAAARDLLQSACELGLEGIMGKLRTSPYTAGRSGHWIKLKCAERQEFVVGGYTDPKGGRAGFGALLLGYYDDEGRLRYAGNVGSGFSDAALKTLHHHLKALRQPRSPFLDPPPTAGVHWVRPRLAAEVAFSQWTDSGRIRHAVFHAMREDKPTSLMKREQVRPITNPERVVDTRSKTRKGDIAAYYERVGALLMPHLKDRPVAMLRAPDGLKGELFFQKHMDVARLEGLVRLDPALDPGHDPLVVVGTVAGLTEAAQLNVIEFHTWNAVRSRIDRPDRISFDLDPGKGVEWPAIQEAALLLRNFLQELGLPAFLKTSGGKGLHVVVPIIRRYDWDTAKGFSRAVVQHMADVLPRRFSAKSGPRNRVGRIFIDYLRNGFGATTVSAWSLRARPGMGVSVPVGWSEVETIKGGDHWTIADIDERLDTGNEPWSAYENAATALGPAMKRLGYRHQRA